MMSVGQFPNASGQKKSSQRPERVRKRHFGGARSDARPGCVAGQTESLLPEPLTWLTRTSLMRETGWLKALSG